MKHVAPQLIVNSVPESVEYYTKKLGFKVEWIHEHNPKFTIISREGVTLMLRELQEEGHVRPNKVPFVASGWHHSDGKEAWDVYIWVEDAKALYEELINKEVSVLKPLSKSEYGNLDFEIEDINGYVLCFGQILD
ncbi:VOC family protein [Winogradskyella sp. 3972H.M.0a.05]|uniref:VOC family protein n=1 Tax=Winogradskyella sp. 3972H.M.0a.05 TaxID=2950277 RepID=UPI0033936D8B